MSRSYRTGDIKQREKQHGFCTGKSCLESLLRGSEGISERVDVGDLLYIVPLAFLKMFSKGCFMKGSYRN